MSRILAVEDSPTQGKLLCTDLAAAGFDVVLASHGGEALDCLETQSFDLVVSDIVMPGMDGYELCRRIKARDQNLPVVLLTSLTDPIEIIRGLEAGADNFLRKPYLPGLLVSRLRTILHHRELRSPGHAQSGLEVVLKRKRFLITAERQQILDLLISSFEDLVEANRQLHEREEALTAASDRLHEQLGATERERRRLNTVLGAAPQAIVITDEHAVVTDASDRLLSLLGHSHDQFVGHSIIDRVGFFDSAGDPLPPDERPLSRALLEEGIVEMGASFDLLLETPAGPVPVIARASAVRDERGRVIAAVGALHEIGSLAAYDPLTKLPNQTLFVDRVAAAATLSREHGRKCGVLAVVVDRFSRLRERLTPPDTDCIVTDLGRRLRKTLAGPEVDQRTTLASAAYFGDGMFGVVLPNLEDEIDGVRLARLIARRLDGIVERCDVSITVTTTVAAVFDASGAADPVQLVTAATTTARRTSQRGGGRVEVTDPTVGSRADDELRREAELREAVRHGGLELHYQPQLAVRRETPVAVEALVRWRHPERGLVPPAGFISLAEETGLLVPLGWWVLREACRQAAQWRGELPGAEDLSISVNLSAAQLAASDAADRVADVLAETGLDPHALVLEVTESEVVADAETAVERLDELTRLGVRIAVDDFGTGYSSLLQLRRFPVQSLKVDRRFVAGMTSDSEDAAIVAASVGLSRALGLETVAEGVETRDQLAELRALGCELGQGYLWSRPLPPAELEQWWQTRRRRAAGGHRTALPFMSRR